MWAWVRPESRANPSIWQSLRALLFLCISKLDAWSRYQQQLDGVGVGVDLIVNGWEDAARLAQSRWHVMGDVAREGQVLYVAG